MMKDCSPLLLELNENDPGIIVTQSVHKQQAGFSQTSQIHKKTGISRDRAATATTSASTTPLCCMPPPARSIRCSPRWTSTPRCTRAKAASACGRVRARGDRSAQMLLDTCTMIKPFVPDQIDGKPWQAYDTAAMANDLRFFNFVPGENGTPLRAMPNRSTSSIRANCCSPRRASIPPPAATANSASRRPFWPTTCVKTASCRKMRSQLDPVPADAGGRHRQDATSGGPDRPLREAHRAELCSARCCLRSIKTTSSATKTTPSASCARNARPLRQLRR